MKLFADKDREKKHFEFGDVIMKATQRETYSESKDEPGCFHKRVFWEATITEGPYSSHDHFHITGEGETKAKAIVAVVEALLAK